MACVCCDFCLATDPLICPRANNNALGCVLQQTWANLRDTNGDYAATINNSFPPEARNLTPAHVDCLINYTAPAAAALGPEAAAIVADWNTLAHANAYRVLEIAMGMPAQAINIKSNMLRIQAGATAAQAVVIQTILKEVGEALAAHKAGSSSSTSEEYRSRQEPLGLLFQLIAKRVVMGLEYSMDDAKAMFDATEGKIVVPFAKTVMIPSYAQLVYIWTLFVEAVCTLSKCSPSVWLCVHKDMMRRNLAGGSIVQLQAYVTRILKLLDQKTFPNAKVLYAHGDHNQVWMDIVATVDVNPGGKNKPPTGTVPVIKNKKYTFGAVTDTTGAGLGLIKTKGPNPQPMACREFHANPRVPCTNGGIAGEVGAADVGKCLFKH